MKYPTVEQVLAAEEAEAKLVFEASPEKPFQYVWRMQNRDGVPMTTIAAATQAEAEELSTKTLADLMALRPLMAQAAQKVYDDWELDEDGMHWEVGGGGICHLIVDEILGVLRDFNATSLSLDTEVHVIAVVQVQDGIYEVDVPHRIYETGGGYSWQKIPGVKFTPEDVVIQKISGDPQDFKNYTGDW